MNDVVAVGIALIVLVALAWFLYSSRVQSSTRYQATVVPLSNIMDVGFIVMSPAIVLLAGYGAPLVMLGICLVAIATGFAMAYNIRHFEPLQGSGDRILGLGRVSRYALTFASVINIAYYTLLLVTLALWPLDAYSERNLAIVGTLLLGGLIIIGLAGRMDDPKHALAVYRSHNNEVAQTIPFDRLLVYEVKEGWEPLCRFLDVPIPDESFPRVNTSSEFHRRPLEATSLK